MFSFIGLNASGVNFSSGTTQIHDDGRVAILNDTVIFNNGMVITPRSIPTSTLTLGFETFTTGASDASFVDGYVQKYGVTPFNFPIGDSARYRYCGVSASSGNPMFNFFRAAYFKSNPNAAILPFGAMPTNQTDNTIKNVSTIEYWDIDGIERTNITLSWDALSKVDTMASYKNMNNLVVAGYNPLTSRWENLGGTPSVGSDLNTVGTVTSVSSVAPSEYTAFTLATLIKPKLLIIWPDTVVVLMNDSVKFTPIVIPSDSVYPHKLTFCNGKDTMHTRNGFAKIFPDGSVKFYPKKDFLGIDTICLIACSKIDTLNCSPQKLVIVKVITKFILNLNDDIAVIGNGQINVNIKILDNDIIIPQNHPGAKKPKIIIPPKNGTLNVFSDGTVTYTPFEGFEGADSFLYEICLDGLCDSAWVRIYTSKTPNLISPNGDGVNDIFELPELVGNSVAKVFIYNRWGDMVWTNVVDYNTNQFRGMTIDGDYLPDGTYFYVIRYSGDIATKTRDKSGFIEVYR